MGSHCFFSCLLLIICLSLRVMSILYFRFPKRRGELIRIKISVVRYLNASMRNTKVRVFVETWAACPQEASGSETVS